MALELPIVRHVPALPRQPLGTLSLAQPVTLLPRSLRHILMDAETAAATAGGLRQPAHHDTGVSHTALRAWWGYTLRILINHSRFRDPAAAHDAACAVLDRAGLPRCTDDLVKHLRRAAPAMADAVTQFLLNTPAHRECRDIVVQAAASLIADRQAAIADPLDALVRLMEEISAQPALPIGVHLRHACAQERGTWIARL